MKKNLFLFILLSIASGNCWSQAPDSLVVHYYENYPYAYSEGGSLKGIEIDIITEYVAWLKQKKNVQLVVAYKPHKEFSAFYNAAKGGSSKVIGLGSVTANAAREKEVLFSPPYLQNTAVLICDGRVPTIKTRSAADVSAILGGLSALVVTNSSHVAYLSNLKKIFVPALQINYTETQNSVLDKIASDKKVFGYVDIVAYWSYLKMNPDKFLKIQKAFNEPRERMGFVMPMSSLHALYINEFFEAGFGFTATRVYRQILEKYLGYEIIESVEIK